MRCLEGASKPRKKSRRPVGPMRRCTRPDTPAMRVSCSRCSHISARFKSRNPPAGRRCSRCTLPGVSVSADGKLAANPTNNSPSSSFSPEGIEQQQPILGAASPSDIGPVGPAWYIAVSAGFLLFPVLPQCLFKRPSPLLFGQVYQFVPWTQQAAYAVHAGRRPHYPEDGGS